MQVVMAHAGTASDQAPASMARAQNAVQEAGREETEEGFLVPQLTDAGSSVSLAGAVSTLSAVSGSVVSLVEDAIVLSVNDS